MSNDFLFTFIIYNVRIGKDWRGKMKHLENDVFDLIRNGKTIREIRQETNTNFRNLSLMVWNITQKNNMVPDINDSGELRYVFDDECMNTISIDLKYAHNFRAMVISDTHFGNSYSNFEYLDLIYDYCRRNGIHIIIHCGDFIDGTFSREYRDNKMPKAQIINAINNYPFDDRILNLVCFGNHDYSAFEMGINIREKIQRQRYDIIPFALGCGVINIGSDIFYVRHKIEGFNYMPIENHFALDGHSHKMMITSRSNFVKINVPTLSDLCFDENQSFPGAIDMNLSLNNNFHIASGQFTHLIICDELKKVRPNLGGIIETGRYNYKFAFEMSPIYDKTYIPNVLDDNKHEIVKKYGYTK